MVIKDCGGNLGVYAGMFLVANPMRTRCLLKAGQGGLSRLERKVLRFLVGRHSQYVAAAA